MKSAFGKHLDLKHVNSLLEEFNKATDFVTGIVDLEGNVLFKPGRRTICTEFHRKNPETAAKCIESDTRLAAFGNLIKT